MSQALHVAYLLGTLPVTQKGNTQVAIERLMDEAGVRSEAMRDGTLNFSGMSPMEVRGQCAMVRGAVEHHCAPMERHAIHAWFAHDGSKAEGVLQLRDYCAAMMTIESPTAQMLIVWHVHAQGRARDMCTERAIAGEHQLSQSTVHRNIVKVAQTASALRRRGMDRLEAMFVRDGVIEAVSTETTRVATA